ncbi:MAG: fibronectin type III domain-containing protein, partial [Candidatus Cloacimonetes bacterium]|nr:fibronectin type III domain-containing protein [Candidatus Cloacimonadota bacterium]
GSSTYTLQVGVIANPQDPLTFTPIETITTPTTWTEYIVPLNSYTGAGQTIAFRHGFGSTSQAIYVDDVSLELIAENDLACTSITGNTTPSVDFPVTYQANIFNWGFVSQSTYTVKLYNADDVELATAAGITCAPGATVQVPITWTPTVEGPVSIYAKVILPGDQNTTNDQSPSLNVLVMGAGALVVSIGDGTSVNTITGYPTPYGTYYKNFHQQYLYTAADIMANGGAPGLFTAIGFDVQALNTCSPMPNFRIRMKTTQQTALTTTFGTGDYTQVWLQNDFLPVVGWNTHTLTTPFYWDGVSNLLVDIVTNLIPGTNTQNSSVYYTPTTGNYTCLRYQSNTVEADIGTTGTVSVNRANIRFNMEALSDPIIMHQIEPITTLMNTDYVLETLDYYFYGDLVNYSIHDNQYIGWAMDSGDITLIPDHNWHGVEYIKIRATNVQGHFVEQTVKVTVWETDSISENFDHSGSVAPGWTTTHSGTTTYPWQPYLVDGVDFGLMTMASLGGTTNERLVSPMFDLSMYQDIQVSFTTDFLPYAGATGTFAYTLNNLTYVTIETIDATFDGIKTYDLPALTGKSSVRFRWTYFNDTQNPGLDNHWVVDNFSIFATVRDIFPPDPVLGFSVQSLGPGSATMQWFASSDQYFCRYQIFISADDQVTTTDQLWSVDNDPLLANVQTISTTLMGLTTGQYWAAIRAVDQSNNYSSLSEAVGIFIDANPPMLSAPIPGNQPLPNWCTTTSATIGCSIEDEHSAVNMTSLQYRLDANGNGMYDYEEVWTDVSLGSTAPGNRNPDHIAFEIELPDNGVFSWELRVADTLGNTAYSGFQGIQGITDDWVVRVDTTPPGEMNVFFVDSIGDNSVQLTWTASSDLNFSGYRIYYGDDPGITMEDALWDFNDDPVMLLPGSGLVSTTITGLIPSTRYYFRLIATDEAGWITAYPEEITAMTSAIDEPLAPQNLTLSIQGD